MIGCEQMKTRKSKPSHGEEYFQSEEFRSNLRKHAVRGAGATLVSQFSTFFIQMVAVAFLARLLTPEDFGLVAMVLVIYVFFRLLRSFGLMDATIQEKELDHRKVSTDLFRVWNRYRNTNDLCYECVDSHFFGKI